MLAGVSSTKRMTCLSASLLIVLVAMKVQPFDFAQFQERRFKIEFVYGRAQGSQSKFVYDARRGVAKSGVRLRGIAIARSEQFPKAFSCGRCFVRVEAPIRFTSRALGDDVRQRVLDGLNLMLDDGSKCTQQLRHRGIPLTNCLFQLVSRRINLPDIHVAGDSLHGMDNALGLLWIFAVECGCYLCSHVTMVSREAHKQVSIQPPIAGGAR